MANIAHRTPNGNPDEARVIDATIADLRAIVREELAELAPAAVAEVLTTDEACAYLRCSRATLHRAVLAGAVRQRKLLESPRYLKRELDEDLRGVR